MSHYIYALAKILDYHSTCLKKKQIHYLEEF